MAKSILKRPIAILGAGSWGSALAIHLASHKQSVRLWDVQPEHIARLSVEGVNQKYLPGHAFPESLQFFDNLHAAVDDVEDVLCAVPSHAFREILMACKPYLRHNVRLVWVTKGLDPFSQNLLSQVATEVLGKISLAVLSGPSFAKEVAAGMPTAVVIAANQITFLQDLIQRFNQGSFRVYHNEDIIGVQIGGALKNVFAIAAGASDGLGFGTNARCALISRGLAEMLRLGTAMGARQETFMGLAGMGDLILTCTDNQSRNRRFGLALGQGKAAKEAETEIKQVIEGKITAGQALKLAARYGVEMPITEQVYQLLQGNITAQKACQNLLAREVRAEF